MNSCTVTTLELRTSGLFDNVLTSYGTCGMRKKSGQVTQFQLLPNCRSLKSCW